MYNSPSNHGFFKNFFQYYTKMKFSRGSIVRIHLKDFLTFDEIEMSPKNKLNLVIGPNGAGKSTFVCAIVLGLGGKPNVIGRSPNVADYIKHGCEKALIELELYNPDGANFVISRHITSNTSSWFLQGKPTTLKKIESLTQELNIQINNLCQILPQDRVQDFAKMDQKQLLENTQKAIDQELSEQFEELKSIRTSIIKREEMLADMLIKFDNEKQKSKRMEADVKSYREKQDILEKISLIKKKFQWLLYEEKNECRKKMQITYETAKQQYEELKKSLEPLLKKIKEVEQERENLKQNSKTEEQNNNKISHSLQELLRNHLRFKDKIVKIKDDLRSKLDAEAQKDFTIQEIQKQIREIENSLPQDNEAKLLHDIRKCDVEIDLMLKKVAQARNKERELQDQRLAVNNIVRGLQYKLDQLNSVAQKKLELLTLRFEDVAKAHQWVLENQNQFEKKVYAPIFLEVNVPDTAHARYFEHIISNKDLIAFVCEDPKDMTKLLRILRDGKNLKINAITSTPLQRSLQETFQSRVPISSLQRLGFKNYLIDLIEGPDVILKYLCSSYNLHNIPLGSNKVEDCLDHIPKEIRAFFTETSFHKVNISKYTGEKIQTVGEVGGAYFLSFTLNKDLITACSQELQRKFEDCKGIENQLKEVAEIRQSLDVEVNTTRNKKREFSRQLEYLKASSVRLRVKREELDEITKKKIDPAVEEAKAKHATEECITEIISNEAETVKVISSYMKSKAASELFGLQLQQTNALVKKKENESKEMEKAAVAARDEAERVKAECIRIKTELKAIHQKAKEMTEGLDANDPAFIEKYNPLFRKLPGDRNLLQEHLIETEAMAKCLQGIVGSNVIEEYEDSLKKIAQLEKEVTKLKANHFGIVSKASELLSTWLPKLQDLIEDINDKFGAFFAAMGCAGIVELDQGSDPSHYENYGLMIKVKFRNEYELQALDSYTQSGGERALTTAVFLLSLQTISKVPFRCVDEINQGMDEINEKRVYHLIMNSISTCDTAQYFLVTPTLLPGVTYPDGTAVHCVHSTKEQVEFHDIHWNKERYFRRLGIHEE
ncbi:structural maintenance of chromosomes protein 5 isoform X2 [Halyomorpha halys]|uniref:structural maintenance of chromosomes protein 5 isoform X2 n=1 Tax=Halyomorpha halys TaxID=286706 RepID=UPI0006D509D3|nr:structural maintenance of chromosomes protein 5 isoform X2 [Halyomorpha halys]